ncbi:hypothetical protein VZG28_04820 [Synechococcus elongatus IITB4]|uniref:hypothetical protein n=1 Tax=Synechococcus elongatus TaxID=32046 RepID=UPI0030CDAEE1
MDDQQIEDIKTYEDHHGNRVQIIQLEDGLQDITYKAAPGWTPLWWSDSQYDEPVKELPTCFIPTDDENRYYCDHENYIRIDELEKELDDRISKVYFNELRTDYISFLRHPKAVYTEEGLYEDIDRTLHYWFSQEEGELDGCAEALVPLAYCGSKDKKHRESECFWLVFDFESRQTYLNDGSTRYVIEPKTSVIFAELTGWIDAINRSL